MSVSTKGETLLLGEAEFMRGIVDHPMAVTLNGAQALAQALA